MRDGQAAAGRACPFRCDAEPVFQLMLVVRAADGAESAAIRQTALQVVSLAKKLCVKSAGITRILSMGECH